MKKVAIFWSAVPFQNSFLQMGLWEASGKWKTSETERQTEGKKEEGRRGRQRERWRTKRRHGERKGEMERWRDREMETETAGGVETWRDREVELQAGGGRGRREEEERRRERSKPMYARNKHPNVQDVGNKVMGSPYVSCIRFAFAVCTLLAYVELGRISTWAGPWFVERRSGTLHDTSATWQKGCCLFWSICVCVCVCQP